MHRKRNANRSVFGNQEIHSSAVIKLGSCQQYLAILFLHVLSQMLM